MAEDIYTQLGIDKSKLKRDYITDPLKKGYSKHKGEYPYKDDLEYLYLDLNISRKQLGKLFNLSEVTIKRWLKYFSIVKDRKLSIKHRINTCLEKYGVNNIFQNKIVREKFNTTMMKKHGVLWPSQMKEWNEKYKLTCLEKYGNEIPQRIIDIKNKQYMSLKLNGTFGKSKEEDKIYELLCSKYKEVKRQYKTELYPFACDFYIPEIDTYIEYQGFWTHGKEPYIGSKEQYEKVKLFESRNTPQYKKVIIDWTQRDPLKRKTAKENNLKWLEFFNMDEFMKWYKT